MPSSTLNPLGLKMPTFAVGWLTDASQLHLPMVRAWSHHGLVHACVAARMPHDGPAETPSGGTFCMMVPDAMWLKERTPKWLSNFEFRMTISPVLGPDNPIWRRETRLLASVRLTVTVQPSPSIQILRDLKEALAASCLIFNFRETATDAHS